MREKLYISVQQILWISILIIHQSCEDNRSQANHQLRNAFQEIEKNVLGRQLKQSDNCKGAEYCIDNCPYEYVDPGCQKSSINYYGPYYRYNILSLQVQRTAKDGEGAIGDCYSTVCNAVYIYKDIALTTADCLQPLLLSPSSQTSKFKDEVQIVVGEKCLHSNGSEIVLGDFGIIHPDFDNKSESNNLGIIVLKERTFRSWANLTFDKDFVNKDFVNKDFKVHALKSGVLETPTALALSYNWKSSRRNYLSESLLATTNRAVIITDDLCVDLLKDQDERTVEFFNRSTEICAIVDEGTNCAPGGGGSPLFLKDVDGVTLLGLGSWRPAGKCKQPRVFIQVSNYIRWIQQQIINYSNFLFQDQEIKPMSPPCQDLRYLCNNEPPSSSKTCQEYVQMEDCESILGYCECECETCDIGSEFSITTLTNIISDFDMEQTMIKIGSVVEFGGQQGSKALAYAIIGAINQGFSPPVLEAMVRAFSSKNISAFGIFETMKIVIVEGGDDFVPIFVDTFVLATRRGVTNSLAQKLFEVFIFSNTFGSEIVAVTLDVLETAIQDYGCEEITYLLDQAWAIASTLGPDDTFDTYGMIYLMQQMLPGLLYYKRVDTLEDSYGDDFLDVISISTIINSCNYEYDHDQDVVYQTLYNNTFETAYDDIITSNLLNGYELFAHDAILAAVALRQSAEVAKGVAEALSRGAKTSSLVYTIASAVKSGRRVVSALADSFLLLKNSSENILVNFLYESVGSGNFSTQQKDAIGAILSSLIDQGGCITIYSSLDDAEKKANNTGKANFRAALPQQVQNCMALHDIECVDAYLTGTKDCNVIVVHDLCDSEGIRGVFCSKTCGYCQSMIDENEEDAQAQCHWRKKNTCDWKAYDFSDSICRGINTKIFWGDDETPPAYMISLQVPKNTNYKFGECFQHFCGGALIAPNIVVTAAHCIDKRYFGKINNQGKSEKRVYAARAPNCRHDQGFDRLRVHKSFIYEEYNNSYIQGDVAVLELLGSWPGPYLQYQSIWNYPLPEQLDLIVMGYGQQNVDDIGYKNLPFMSLQMYYLPDNLCTFTMQQNNYTEIKEIFSEQLMLCAKADWGATCEGDSGGPLVIKSYEDDEKDILVGINSFGRNVACGKDQLTFFSEVGKNNITLWVHEMVMKYGSGFGDLDWQTPPPLKG